MSLSPAELRATFQSLLKDVAGTKSPDIVRRLIDPASNADLYLAAQAPGGNPGILLRMPKTSVVAPKLVPEVQGFVLRSMVIPEEPGKSSCLALFCTDRAYDDVFMVFAEDVARRVLAATTDKAAHESFLARVALWERFFRAGADAHLSVDAQAGLFAELVVLRDIVMPAVGPVAGVAAWCGPSRAAQDFVIGDVAVEVKSSRAKSAERMSIASELQLDDRPFKALGVVFLLLSEGGRNCAGVNDVIGAIESSLSASELALGAFRDKLLEGGWIREQSARYSETRFFVRARTCYRVVTGFPRIIPGDFSAGVGGIRYTVDVSSIERFKIDEEAVRSWLR